MKQIIKKAAFVAAILAAGAHAEPQTYTFNPAQGVNAPAKPQPRHFKQQSSWNDGKGGDDYVVKQPAPAPAHDELNQPTRPPVYKCDNGDLVLLEMNQLGGSRLTISWPEGHASAYVTKQAGREHPFILRDTESREIIGDARITPQTVWLYVGEGFLHCNRSLPKGK
ncbi:hypothetical protein DOC35_19465 [Salmonella enterica subsp. enterica]|nr:hypothetical protein [Salmonella enterica subsp. enterica]